MNKGPEKKFRAGGCSASVFENSFATPSGVKSVKNVVLERTYKDKLGNFQASKSLSQHDIPKAILVLKQAYEYMVQNRAAAEPGLVQNQQQPLSQEPTS